MEGEEETVENPPLFPYRISRSRCLITRRLIAAFCLTRFRTLQARPAQSLPLSISQKAKNAWEKQSAHFRVRCPGSPLDHRQVVEVFLKRFSEEC